MKGRICVLVLALLGGALLGAGNAHATGTGYAFCGTYASYVLMYKSNDNFEELGKLRCGEKVEILSRYFDFVQVRAQDGRVGWVHYAEVSNNAPGAAPPTNLGLTDQSAKPQSPVVPPLNNANIVKMRMARLSADVIIAKIQSSKCEFDTTPPALQKLKLAGVPDKVILAMVETPSASAPPPVVKAPEFVDVKIPGGTTVDVELSFVVSSDDATEGRVVLLTVAQDVAVDGVTVFQHGAEAHARVTTVKEPGFMGRPPGQVGWTMEYVTAVNGDQVQVNFYSKEAAENPMSSLMGSPGPSWEFKKGKPAVVPAKTKFQVVLRKSGATVRIPQSQGTSASVEAAPDSQN
jgi:hypothetical protein